MKRRESKISLGLLIILSSLFLGACGVDKSGIEIVSEPIAKVYLNGKESGTTPYKNNSLKPGKIQIKLDDEGGNSWEKEIKLENNVTTVINWDFKNNENNGYILSMEKTGEKGSILVNSNPSGAVIYVDGELKNSSPAKIEGVNEGDRKISINYPGYTSINLIVKMVKGYQLVIDSKLEEQNKSEDSVSLNPTPTKTLRNSIKIKETETGWLRVRQEANSGAIEIGKVTPGESYELIQEKDGWYEINFENKNGWISTKYAEKVSE